MRVTSVLLLASGASAISFPDITPIKNLFARKGGNDSGNSGGGSGKCPSVWTSVSQDLTTNFVTDGQCNPLARAAIRAIFHDCGAWNTAQGAKGGCDGSLILAGELQRPENNGLQNVSAFLQTTATKWGVGVADMVVFAGNHAIVTCPGGPTVKTYVGRKDSTTPAPDGLLPDVNAPAATLSKLFQDKGFDDRDLAALLGAHSTSNQFNVDSSPGKQGLPQDSTPGVWDVKYYSETLSPPQNVFVFPSDTKLSNYAGVGKEFKGFVNNQGKWNGKFADAMGRMALFGSSGTTGLTDCTDALPKSTNIKREMRAMPMFKPRN